MRKATVTYVAPLGDNKVVEMGDVTFFDGKSVEINSHEHPHLISKLQHNVHFDVVLGEDDKQDPPKAKRGRPSAAMIAEAKAKAEEAEKAANEAADKAKSLKAEADEAVKSGDKPAEKPVVQQGALSQAQANAYQGQASGNLPQNALNKSEPVT